MTEEEEENQQLDIKLRVKGGKRRKPIVGKVLCVVLFFGCIAWVIYRKVKGEPVIPPTKAEMEASLEIQSSLDRQKNGVFGLVKPTDGK